MSCNASYARFIFGKFFASTIILYVLLFTQKFFILAKSGCYNCRPKGVNLSALDYDSDHGTAGMQMLACSYTRAA
jgi:hypothetical protein